MTTSRIKTTHRLVLENMSWMQDLHRRAYEDAGTGLWKQTIIADEIAGSLKDPSALIMLKPDRFKILVDSRGHAAGDEAMIKIAAIIKNISSQTQTSSEITAWPLRFKSNEVGIIISNCGEALAQKTAQELSKEIAAIESVSALGGLEEFNFSSTISWTVWTKDTEDWETLFQGNYANLLETWKNCGNTIVRYSKETKK